MIRHLALAALMFSATASAQQIYDLLIKGGQVINSADHKQGRFDVAVIGKRIARVASDIPAVQARVVVEADGYYVTPGLIDINTHVNIRAGGPNVYPDYNALRSGVTTVVDAGSSDPKDFEAFKSGVIDRAKTRVLAFLNAGSDARAAAAMVAKYPKVLVGLKISDASARDSSAFNRAMEAATAAHTIVMVDSAATPDQLEGLRPGDIYTRIYRQWGQSAGFETVMKSMPAARGRGVLFDVGAGLDGLWFSSAAPAIQEGFLPDTISTGMEKESMLLPGTNMSLIMSKFLNMGLTFDQIVERTTVNAARAIKHSDLANLREGFPADLALFQIQQGKFGFLDSGYTRLNANKRVTCVMTVRDGEIVWDSDGLAAEDWIKAGPYSNFK